MYVASAMSGCKSCCCVKCLSVQISCIFNGNLFVILLFQISKTDFDKEFDAEEEDESKEELKA